MPDITCYVTFYELGELRVEGALTEADAITEAVSRMNTMFATQIADGLLEPVCEEDVAAVEWV